MLHINLRFTGSTYIYTPRRTRWIRSRRCAYLVTWFWHQLIAKPGNKTAAPPCRTQVYIDLENQSTGSHFSSPLIRHMHITKLIKASVEKIIYSKYHICIYQMLWMAKNITVCIYILSYISLIKIWTAIYRTDHSEVCEREECVCSWDFTKSRSREIGNFNYHRISLKLAWASTAVLLTHSS